MQQKSLISIKSLSTTTQDCEFNIKIDSLSISPSKIYALWGLSGHGKSLLLSLLAGYPNRHWLKNINFDEFFFFNEEFHKVDFAKISPLNKKISSLGGKIIYMPQSLPLYKNSKLSIAKELPFLLKAIAPNITKKEIAELRSKARSTISEDILTKQINKLSGGERKRLEILIRIYGAKFLSNQGGCIILLDEPTSGLDVKNERDFLKLIYDSVHSDDSDKGNLSIIISTHSASLLKEENDFFHEHLLMQNCSLIEGKSKDEIYENLTKKEL